MAIGAAKGNPYTKFGGGSQLRFCRTATISMLLTVIIVKIILWFFALEGLFLQLLLLLLWFLLDKGLQALLSLLLLVPWLILWSALLSQEVGLRKCAGLWKLINITWCHYPFRGIEKDISLLLPLIRPSRDAYIAFNLRPASGCIPSWRKNLLSGKTLGQDMRKTMLWSSAVSKAGLADSRNQVN